MDAFLGEIRLMSFNQAPRGWAECNGALLPINQNAALFSLLGVAYGGNGTTTFALPDLRSRVPIHFGSYNGRTYVQGQQAGVETVTLTTGTIPAHTHSLTASTSPAASGATPVPPGPGVVFAQASATQAGGGTVPVNRYASAPGSATMSPNTLGAQGSGLPHTNVQPYLAASFFIATSGVFPSRQ